MERLIDMAAHKIAMDPRDLRLRNLIKPEEFPYKTAPGIVWDRAGFIEALEQGCEKIGYAALREKQIAERAAGRWMGIGISTYAELSGIGSRISASPGMPINTGTESRRSKLIRVAQSQPPLELLHMVRVWKQPWLKSSPMN